MNSTSVVEVLVAARKLIEKPENWAQGYYAYDDSGSYADPGEPGAVKWCMVGACLEVEGLGPDDPDPPAVKALAATLSGLHPVSFNDARNTTHSEVLAAFDRAIKAEKAKVQQ